MQNISEILIKKNKRYIQNYFALCQRKTDKELRCQYKQNGRQNLYYKFKYNR